MRFRKELVVCHLDKLLFDRVTTQLKAKAVTVKTGTFVDATIIASSSHHDEEARWVGHRSRKPVHGFKTDIGADAETALVEEISITLANVYDDRAGPDARPNARPNDPWIVYADSGYRGQIFATAVTAKGGTPHVVQTGVWGSEGDGGWSG